MVELICVSPDQAHLIWDKQNIDVLIYEAMRRGNFSAFRSVERAVLAGRALLWLAVEDGVNVRAAAVTELVTTEWRKACVIVACGGKRMDEWLPLIDGIEKYARDEECSAVQIIGRKGWTRKLKDYRTANVVLEKELT